MGKTKQIRQSKPRVDLTGKHFGQLTPYEYIKGGKWKCKCSCGNETIVDTRNLNSGHTKSCGCLIKASKNVYDMTNYEDDNIKVLQRMGSDDQQIALWECICKHCGNKFITRGSRIRSGETKSCGCVHSFNEQKITKILLENNIKFSTQYTFPDLKGVGGKNLRFDFAIFDNNNVLSHLIEYNGLQHYEKPEGAWGIEYNSLIQNDQRKKDYCNTHNIKLKIIKYNESYDLNDLIKV